MEHEYGINDEEVLMAIKYHTTGRQQMTKTEKLILLQITSNLEEQSQELMIFEIWHTIKVV